MRLEIPKRVNPNAPVYRMGFVYPICIWHRHDFLQARSTLAETALGPYTKESDYHTTGRLKSSWQHRDHCGWYAGQRRWQERVYPQTDFWLVFQTEQDRTPAMMYLG